MSAVSRKSFGAKQVVPGKALEGNAIVLRKVLKQTTFFPPPDPKVSEQIRLYLEKPQREVLCPDKGLRANQVVPRKVSAIGHFLLRKVLGQKSFNKFVPRTFSTLFLTETDGFPSHSADWLLAVPSPCNLTLQKLYLSIDEKIKSID